MMTGTGKYICDQEIFSRNRQLWVGCKASATQTKPTQWHPSGLHYCTRHAPEGAARLVCEKKA